MLAKILAGTAMAGAALVAAAVPSMAANPTFATTPAPAADVTACTSDLVMYANAHGGGANGISAVVMALQNNTLAAAEPACYLLTSSQFQGAAVTAYAQLSSVTPTTSPSATVTPTSTVTGTATATAAPTQTVTTPPVTVEPTATVVPTVAPATGGGTGGDTGLIVMAVAGGVLALGGGALAVQRTRKNRG